MRYVMALSTGVALAMSAGLPLAQARAAQTDEVLQRDLADKDDVEEHMEASMVDRIELGNNQLAQAGGQGQEQQPGGTDTDRQQINIEQQPGGTQGGVEQQGTKGQQGVEEQGKGVEKGGAKTLPGSQMGEGEQSDPYQE